VNDNIIYGIGITSLTLLLFAIFVILFKVAGA